MLAWINEYLLGPAVAVCLLVSGLWYGGALRFFWLTKPGAVWRALTRPREGEGISPLGAMTVALAGTLGVGNIVGVASAITLGGPGAVFWMWVSALCAMVLKYAEITLALRHRRYAADGTPLGGAMYYIADCADTTRRHGRRGRALGSIFALLCLLNALTMGSVIQTNAVSEAFDEVAGLSAPVVGITLAALTLLALRRGIGGVAKLTERLIPLMTVGYILLSAAVLMRMRSNLPGAVASIFTSAACPESAAGGVGAFLFSRGLRYGAMRGLLSNEAGCGTAPIAHAASSARNPAEQGVWGIVEVFVDTILLCTMTALVILCAGGSAGELDGMRLALFAFRAALGEGAGWFLCLAIFVFAYATLLCWAHYGQSCIRWFGEGVWGRRLFLVAFAFSIYLGAVAAPAAVWELADFALALMTLMNLIVLCILMPEVREETKKLR